MIQASQLRTGMCILFEEDICRVMTSHHVTPGNLRGFVQAKMRNLRNGNSFEHRFSSTEKVERAILDTQPMEYLYSDPSGHHFMNQDSYEQITLDDEVLGDSMLYLLPNTVIQIDFYDEKAGRHRAAEHGHPRGRRHRAQHEGGHRQRLLQAGQDGDRPDGQRAALHRGGDQDHHRHPRKQVPEPGVNPQLLVEGLTWFVVFIFSTTLHEAGHALAAWKLGDSTAYEGGQVSLNPLPHIRREPVGMVLVPLISFAMSHWMMGWASAPYDPLWAHRYPKRAALMAAAGPAANLLLVLVGGAADPGRGLVGASSRLPTSPTSPRSPPRWPPGAGPRRR